MINRKIIKDLSSWKATQQHKALLIKGARQVGKTTIVRHFGQENYQNFIEINFEKMPTARQAFDGNLDIKTIQLNLSAMGFGPFVKGETLIFFDEIQSCPKARTAIKFLVEDGSYDYIESGSLLGINYKDVSSYPVGFEHQIEMFPLDFEEFLWACGISQDVIKVLRDSFTHISPVPEFLHKQIMERFRQYLIIGGMPEVVSRFLSTNDFNLTGLVQDDIINSYRDDISKYADKDKALAKKVFDAIPAQLAKEKKRFILADLEIGASQRKYADATQWLCDAGVAYHSFHSGAFELPFSFTEKRNLYKLFMSDTGLLCRLSFPTMQFQILNGEIEINEGALAENYVAAELVKHGHRLHYYDKKSRQELDFIYPDGKKITIIEVKSGKDYKRHASVDSIIETSESLISKPIILSRYNVDRSEEVIYYPLYMTMFL